MAILERDSPRLRSSVQKSPHFYAPPRGVGSGVSHVRREFPNDLEKRTLGKGRGRHHADQSQREAVRTGPGRRRRRDSPQPPGSGAAGARRSRKRKQSPRVPLPHCPPKRAAAAAATTMPKRKKQSQQQPPPQHPTLPDREETGDEEESPIGPPSLLGPPPMANGEPGDPTPAFRRGPPGSRRLRIPPLLSLPPPPRGRGPFRGGLGPRTGPYGRGWWGVNAEPLFRGPGHRGPPRESFYKEQTNPRRLRSWSLAKRTCPPKDSPQVVEDKSNRPVCRHFSKKGHCRYEDLCAFYHPGDNGPPL
nr:proline-rich protein 3 isoform X1 [Cavia porcellus]